MSNTLTELNKDIDSIINEDTLDDLRKEWEVNQKLADKSAETKEEQLIKLAAEKTTVVTKSEDPRVADMVTITTKDPSSDTTAVEKISPGEPVVKTITTREKLDQAELNDILQLAGKQVEPVAVEDEEEDDEDDETEELNEKGVMPWLGDLGPQDDEKADADEDKDKKKKVKEEIRTLREVDREIMIQHERIFEWMANNSSSRGSGAYN